MQFKNWILNESHIVKFFIPNPNSNETIKYLSKYIGQKTTQEESVVDGKIVIFNIRSGLNAGTFIAHAKYNTNAQFISRDIQQNLP